MVFINSDGKFNENTYLIDAELYRMKGNLAIYIIENENMRVMIDTPSDLMARRFVKKIKEFGLYPIHKIILTHSHFDHVQGVGKLKKLMQETKIEVLASERAIDNLKNPDKLNKDLGYNVNPIDNVTPLKEGDIIDVSGLKLEIMNFFGHTQDSIAILDRKNKNIFIGDAIMNMYEHGTFIPTFMSRDFNESELLKTFQKLRTLKEDLHSISLSHFGVWKDEDFFGTLNKMEAFHFNTKESILKWYNENPSLKYITLKYHEKFTPDSKVHTKDNIRGLELLIEWLIEGLKITGDIK